VVCLLRSQSLLMQIVIHFTRRSRGESCFEFTYICAVLPELLSDLAFLRITLELDLMCVVETFDLQTPSTETTLSLHTSIILAPDS